MLLNQSDGFRSPGAPQKGALIALLFAAIFGLPYFVPVSPTVSTSYLAGFNTKMAVMILALGTGLFAWFTNGGLYQTQDDDSRLSWKVLVGAVALTFATCLFRLHLTIGRALGGDTYYFLNRQQMVAAGLVPYRQFEFAYGPLLLYPSVWISQGCTFPPLKRSSRLGLCSGS